jgi:hypothetical protein
MVSIPSRKPCIVSPGRTGIKAIRSLYTYIWPFCPATDRAHADTQLPRLIHRRRMAPCIYFFFSFFSFRFSFGLSWAFFWCSFFPLSFFPLSPISVSPCLKLTCALPVVTIQSIRFFIQDPVSGNSVAVPLKSSQLVGASCRALGFSQNPREGSIVARPAAPTRGIPLPI